MHLGLCKNEVATRVWRWYRAILLQIVQPIIQLSFVCIIIHLSLFKVNNLAG